MSRACAEALELRQLLTGAPSVTAWSVDVTQSPHRLHVTFSHDVSASLELSDLSVDQVTTNEGRKR